MLALRRPSGLLVAAAIAVFATSSAAGQSKLKCRDLPTSMHNVSIGPGGGGTSDYTCSFNQQTLNYTCQVHSKSSVGVIDQATVATYASLDDVIDEVAVTPPRMLAAKMQLSGMGLVATTTYTYDAKKRALREVMVSPGATTTLNYTAWDASGRPTRSRSTSTAPSYVPIDDDITYDDVARTATHTQTGGPGASTTVIEFNPLGYYARITAQTSVGKTIATMTILATEKICRP